MRTLTKPDTGMYARALMRSAGLDAIAGAWLFLSAFMLHHGVDSLFINNVTCGALAVVLAFGGLAHVRLAWLPAAIGAWVAISPLALGFTHNTVATVNNVATGIVILILAVQSWIVSKSAHDPDAKSEW